MIPPLSPAGAFALFLCLLLTWPQLTALAASASDPDLQQLMSQDVSRGERSESVVTSVGKRNQKLSETAAATYVVTQEDIRRSGVTSIPDALRMVPGLDVARIDSNKWSVSSRGFASRFANKLLVLMDGREVYSPTFGGVYWEVQDTPLADIDRIEVIRGPGASLWGANAVNGVINIITKSARETTGGHLSAGVGTFEKNFGSFRYGRQVDDNTAARVWASGFSRGTMDNTSGGHNDDDWSMARTGFRLDRDNQRGSATTVLGNAYSGYLHNNLNLPTLTPPYSASEQSRTAVSGFNLLGRWKKSLSLSSEISLQAYFDHVYRRESFLTEERDTFDIEMQHRLALNDSHAINWGLGYRYSQDRYGAGTSLVYFRDPRVGRQVFSLFVQDDVELIANTLTLTLGSKFQHNDFTGFEGQPSLRLLWRVNDHHTLWGAISRAVRTPTRGDDNAVFLTSVIPPNFITYRGQPNPVPVLAYADGNPRLATEQMIAYELGYRLQQHPGLYLDAALFFNDYDRLRGLDFNNPTIDYSALSPLAIAHGSIQNSMAAQSLGAEWLAHWEPVPWWKMDLSYAFVKTHFRSLNGPLNFSSENGMTPQQQVSFRSGFDIVRNVDLDFWLRYVDQLPLHGTATGDSPAIPPYVTLDTRLAWRPAAGLELSLVGQNLLSGGHAEMEQELFSPPRTKIPRAMYVKLDWRF